MITTYHYRIKDANSRKLLNKMAGTTNFVWNFCNSTSYRAISERRQFLSQFDLNSLTANSSELLDFPSASIQEICREYTQKRRQFKKSKLKWRYRKRGTLGWIPFRASQLKLDGDHLKFYGIKLKFWNCRTIPVGSKLHSGNFSQDSRGRWYVNIVIETTEIPVISNNPEVGIDLGLKTLATLSDGEVIEIPQFYRKTEAKLAKVQRAKKKKQVRNLHAKIKNQRHDFAHKATTKIVNKYGKIYVGNVSSSKLAKTKMAKSVYDAGWAMFKTMLNYKSIRIGVIFREINESFSTVTCSRCLQRSGPSGLSALGVREWSCMCCGVVHDRDVNAAQNILRFGRETP